LRNKVCRIIEYLNGFFLVAGILLLVAMVGASVLNYDLKEQYLLYLPILGIFLVILITEHYLTGILLYLTVNIGVVLLTLLIPMPILTRIFFLFVSGILIILSISSRLKHQENPMKKPNALIPAFLGLIYVIGSCIKSFPADFMVTVSYYLTFTYVILLVLYKNLTNLRNYLDVNRFVQNIPTKQIDRTNLGMLALYEGIMVLAMILLPLTGIGNLFGYLGKALRYLVVLIFRGMGSDTPADSTVDEFGPSDNGIAGLGFDDPSPTPAWLTIFYKVMTYVVVIGVGLFLLCVIIAAIIRAVKKFHKPVKNSGDVEEFITARNDEKSSVLPSLKDILKRPDWLDFSPNAVVRRTYRKTILKAAAEAPSPAMTPSELEAFAGLPAGNDTDLLHTLYEKARYTEGGVTKEEAKLLKK